jgi:hypothetical protein
MHGRISDYTVRRGAIGPHYFDNDLGDTELALFDGSLDDGVNALREHLGVARRRFIE